MAAVKDTLVPSAHTDKVIQIVSHNGLLCGLGESGRLYKLDGPAGRQGWIEIAAPEGCFGRSRPEGVDTEER